MGPVQPDPDILAELKPRSLLLAYGLGVFPMVEDGELMWFCPDPRGLLPLDERFHVARRLARTIRQGRFTVTVDRAFGAVMDACADRPEGTWISPEIHAAYRRLHELGVAHSVEAWPIDAVGQGTPAGGLYGLALGGAFFAESMYHHQTDAGKVALAWLVERLRTAGFVLFDLQWTTPNLKRFGAYDVSRGEYVQLLTRALACRPKSWRTESAAGDVPGASKSHDA